MNLILKLSVILTISNFAFADSSKDLRFTNACQRGTQITISAVGDLLLHSPLQAQAFRVSDGYKSLWSEAIPYLQAADIAYANLEGPIAETPNATYTGYPSFNYHPMLVDDLLDSGIDVVSTSNNHSLDRGSNGANLTIQALENGGLLYAGTERSSKPDLDKIWYTVTTVKNKNIAWIACTYGTNGVPDRHNQVMDCFDSNQTVSRYVAFLSKVDAIDAVIVTPHWGQEYQPSPSSRQRRYMRAWLESGATAVIGSHPHVVQEWERHVTQDGRETLVIYSLGNFVSGQGALAKRATIIAHIGITISRNGANINGVRYTPALMLRTGSTRFLSVDSLAHYPEEQRKTLNHLSRFFGTERRLLPGEDLVTNPECR